VSVSTPENVVMSQKPAYETLEKRVKVLERALVECNRAEGLLFEEKSFSEAAIHGLPGVFYLFDEKGQFIRWNKNLEEVSGYSPEEVSGMHATDFFEGEEKKRVAERIEEAFVKGQSSVEAQFVSKSGKKTPYYFTGVRAVIGDKPYLVGMGIDIVERKRSEEALRESERKYSILVESSLTGIYIDQDEKIVFANSRFAEMYGYSRQELMGIESWKLVHPEDRALTDQRRAKRLKGEDVPSEYHARGLMKSGKTIWVARRNARIEYHGRAAILGNVVDITERVQAEQNIRKMNEELKNFVRVVSHDLKTPIISIQGVASRLLQKYGQKLDDKGVVYVNQIRASAGRMEALVTDLLELSQLGSVVSVFRVVSSDEIVKEVASELEERFKGKGIQLIVSEDLPSIYCDRERIYQVFENLLVNAVKFIGNTTNPRIEVGYEDRGAFHQFYVRDNGIGIDPKYHAKIFEMFERLKEVEDEKGTGLGLAIVDRIVTSHGGKVWVDSEKAKGSTFYFTLQKAPEGAL
jgi:PAS domain S-box-containing protein